MIIFSVYNRLPANFRYQLKKLFRTAGHSESWLDGLIARRDARGKKSLARSLQHTLHLLDAAGIESLAGLRTLDFGAGYVPTDTISHWLLGALEATALDYNAIANFEALKLAISRDSETSLLKLLRPSLQQQFSQRLAQLRNLEQFTPETLEALGISYLAPFDILSRRPAVPFDLILSTSVLEHIARKDIAALLQALSDALTSNGRMIHEIHLEDHLDIRQDPFNFFRTSTDFNPATDHDARGNRVLRREWAALFGGLTTCHSTEMKVRFTARQLVPSADALLPEYAALSPDELFVSHVIYVSQRTS